MQFPGIDEMLEPNVNIEDQPLFFKDDIKENKISFNKLREDFYCRELDEGFDCSIEDVEDSLVRFFSCTKNVNAKHNRDALLVMHLLGYRWEKDINPIRKKCMQNVLRML